ncbi:hypothetical protein U1Q18_021726 [Sarracenia purpurea var. burkii]
MRKIDLSVLVFFVNFSRKSFTNWVDSGFMQVDFDLSSSILARNHCFPQLGRPWNVEKSLNSQERRLIYRSGFVKSVPSAYGFWFWWSDFGKNRFICNSSRFSQLGLRNFSFEQVDFGFERLFDGIFS